MFTDGRFLIRGDESKEIFFEIRPLFDHTFEYRVDFQPSREGEMTYELARSIRESPSSLKIILSARWRMTKPENEMINKLFNGPAGTINAYFK